MCKSVDTDQWKSVVYLYKGMLFNGEKEQATDAPSMMSLKHKVWCEKEDRYRDHR